MGRAWSSGMNDAVRWGPGRGRDTSLRPVRTSVTASATTLSLQRKKWWSSLDVSLATSMLVIEVSMDASGTFWFL